MVPVGLGLTSQDVGSTGVTMQKPTAQLVCADELQGGVDSVNGGAIRKTHRNVASSLREIT